MALSDLTPANQKYLQALITEGAISASGYGQMLNNPAMIERRRADDLNQYQRDTRKIQDLLERASNAKTSPDPRDQQSPVIQQYTQEANDLLTRTNANPIYAALGLKFNPPAALTSTEQAARDRSLAGFSLSDSALNPTDQVTIKDSRGNTNIVVASDLPYWQSQGWTQAAPGQAGTGNTPTGPLTPPTSDSGVSQTSSIDTSGWSEAQKASFAALEGYIKELQNQGKTVNPAIQITPEMTTRFLEQAKRESEPYYTQLISQAQQDLEKGFGRIAEDYQAEVKSTGTAFGRDLENTQESFARRGLEFSSDRTRAERELAQEATQSLEKSSRNAQRLAQDLGVKGERTLGSVQFRAPSTFETGFTPTLGRPGQYGIGPSTGREALFSPTGGTTGTLEQDRLAAEEKRKLELIGAERALRGQYTA